MREETKVALEASAREELEKRLDRLESGVGGGGGVVADDGRASAGANVVESDSHYEDEDVVIVSKPAAVAPVERKAKPLPSLQPKASAPSTLSRQWASTNDLAPAVSSASSPDVAASKPVPKSPPRVATPPPTGAAPRRPLPTAKTTTGIVRRAHDDEQ